ncbi:hypothetical protein GCM10009682_08280 [Luedemannella flava]|uniref:Uncharacterized protein n=1 Tax=Luedemannella flava TaxID=349316 RepID=A0ABN2LHG0_9ACTN
MTTPDRADWLVQEISDLLDVSSVGLYEFMEFLNDPDEPSTMQERRTIAQQALDRLMREPGTYLHWQRWAKFEELDEVAVAGLPGEAWDPPRETDGLYVAIDRR